MRISICAVGRLRRGPHKDLFDHYMKLVNTRAPQAGVSGVRHVEIDPRKGPSGTDGRAWQAEQLLRHAPDAGLIVVLDETGSPFSSESFARKLSGWRGEGTKELAFMIGGPFGHGGGVLKRADLVWSLGPATWPHELVPVMIAEQLYRSICIVTGHPYHHG